ncbi:undecaprenyldiphospho-muramoylpentapeptide beta-N-acetylglucosaminyltransferase [bacterium]|nr:undecaprenyldiphospho-muramoylpentapeptide beta-N-acetylglucosaminyltransferase [bacterium]
MNEQQHSISILFAGGKTGGHLYPGIAVAEELLRRRPELTISFAGAGFELPRRECVKRNWSYHYIPSAPFYQSNPFQLLRGMKLNLSGVFYSLKLLRRVKPRLLIVCGGYEGFPLAIAARLRGVPILLLEQNAMPGLTNRVLSPLADAATAAFPGTEKYLRAKKVIVTGNPVRPGLGDSPKDFSRFGLTEGRFTVLVTGGSAGAHRLNMAVVEAADELAKVDKLQFILQTGKADATMIQQAVDKAGLTAYVNAYLDDIGAAYAITDLVVSRSGGSIFELAILGLPAVLVPYPYAAADHQTPNARTFTDHGAARFVTDAEMTGERFYSEVTGLFNDRGKLSEMSAAMKRLGKPKAAQLAAELALELLNT